ncbi:MAG: hypothetical protein ACOY93_04005 [Bacillota bacterium]
MPQWIRPETFAELNVPEVYVHAYVTPLDRTRTRTEIPRTREDLYSYFWSGGELLHQANSDGEIELFVLTETPAEWQQVKWGIQVEEAANQHLVVELVVHDNPENPLLLPFIFALEHIEARYNAAALCEQPTLPVFVLTRQGGRLIQEYCREISLSAQSRFHLRNAVRQACGLPPLASKTMALPDASELLAIGTAYEYRLDALGARLQQARSLVLTEVRMALASLAEHRNSGVRKGPYLLWASRSPLLDRSNQWTEGFTYFVTPLYEERARGRRSEIEPLLERFQSLPGFIRTEHGLPLREGAIPLLRYAEGRLEELNQTPDVIAALADLYDEIAARSAFGWDKNHYSSAGYLQQYTALLEPPHPPKTLSPQERLSEIRALPPTAKRWVYGFFLHLLGIDLDSPQILGVDPSRIRVGTTRHEAITQRIRTRMAAEQRLLLEALYLPSMDTELPANQIVLEDGALLIAEAAPARHKASAPKASAMTANRSTSKGGSAGRGKAPVSSTAAKAARGPMRTKKKTEAEEKTRNPRDGVKAATTSRTRRTRAARPTGRKRK